MDPVQKFFKNCLGDSRQKWKLCPNYCSFYLYWVYFHCKIFKTRQIPWIVSKTGVIEARFSISTRIKSRIKTRNKKVFFQNIKLSIKKYCVVITVVKFLHAWSLLFASCFTKFYCRKALLWTRWIKKYIITATAQTLLKQWLWMQ